MSMMQTFRDGIDPNWKQLWSSVWRALESMLALALLILAMLHMYAGSYDKATLDLVLAIFIRQRS